MVSLSKFFKREKNSHKGDFGKILVVGGSVLYGGAPFLTARAALYSGSDLVSVLLPHLARPPSFSSDLILHFYPGTSLNPYILKPFLSLLNKSSVVTFGNGLGLSKPIFSQKIIQKILSSCYNTPIVLDAEALHPFILDHLPPTTILTPHEKEFERLFGVSLKDASFKEKKEIVSSFARQYQTTIILKGHNDIVSNGVSTFVNKTGNPGMTVGGTGDVLAGVCGSFLALFSPFKAAALAAHVVGSAGDLCFKEKGYWFSASDVIEKIPFVSLPSNRGLLS